MSPFAGGSPWAMARDIGEGYISVTDRTFARMTRSEIDKLAFELGRCLRDLRAQPIADLKGPDLQQRNRKLLKLTSAQRVLRAHLMQRKGP